MGFRIQDIKSQLALGGARPSLFKVRVTFPGELGDLPANTTPGGDADPERKIEFLCRAASIPSAPLNVTEVPYWGRKIKVASPKVSFPEWTITIINDEDFSIRHGFEKWTEAINSHSTNVRTFGATSSPESYKGTAEVLQFGKAGAGGEPTDTPIRKYRFEGLWPSEVAPIELDWGTDNEIEEFTVTLQYDLWELDPNLNE